MADNEEALVGRWRSGTSGLRPKWRRLGIAGLAFALPAFVLPAFADTPQTGIDPSVILTVTPSTGLADGQVLTVTGTGFPAGTVGTLRECGGTVTAPECDLTATSFVTTAAGTIPPTAFAAKRIVNTGATTFNCGVQACALVATAGSKTGQHQIRMASAGTVVSTSSTTTSPSTSSTTSTVPPTSSTSTTTPGVPATTSSTGAPVTTTVVPSSTGCAGLLATQREALAALDSLAAAFPQYRNVAAQAREATNLRMTQALAAAGC